MLLVAIEEFSDGAIVDEAKVALLQGAHEADGSEFFGQRAAAGTE